MDNHKVIYVDLNENKFDILTKIGFITNGVYINKEDMLNLCKNKHLVKKTNNTIFNIILNVNDENISKYLKKSYLYNDISHIFTFHHK